MKATLARLPVIGTAMRMQQRYTEDAADNFAASIGFFGFLSLFPMILVGLSVMGFVIRDDAAAQNQVVSAVQDAVPGLSAALGENGLSDIVSTISESAGPLLSVGFASLLFSGMKVIAGAQRALAVVFRMELPKGLAARLQQLLALAALGVLALVGSAIGGSVGVDLGDGVEGILISVGLTLLAFLVDLLLFAVAYRLLSPDPGEPPWRVIMPGAVLAAIAWVALKAGGSNLLVSSGNSNTYGPLAGAVGLLLLLYLAGRVFMYGAELAAIKAGIDPPVLDGVDDEVEDVAQRSEPDPRPARDEAPPLVRSLRFAGLGIGLGIVSRVLGAMGADDEKDRKKDRKKDRRNRKKDEERRRDAPAPARAGGRGSGS